MESSVFSRLHPTSCNASNQLRRRQREISHCEGRYIPDVHRESRRIEVVCYEVVVADVPSATPGRRSEAQSRHGIVPDVHHTRRMERVCNAEPDAEGKALVDVHHIDERPEHIQDSCDLNDHRSRGYSVHELLYAKRYAHQYLQEWSVGRVQSGIPNSLRQSQTIHPETHERHATVYGRQTDTHMNETNMLTSKTPNVLASDGIPAGEEVVSEAGVDIAARCRQGRRRRRTRLKRVYATKQVYRSGQK